ncbi:hypothetical protein BC828DRAFT_249782 [Blastocladiella britannica]|nr:hypothetical protein BC828DRAFT_249782 [Blastocladiella britannica]
MPDPPAGAIAPDHACIYGLRNQTRALCAVSGDEDRTQFLLGTLGLACENEVHLIQHNDSDDSDDHDRRYGNNTGGTLSHVVFRHPHEIHCMATSASPDAANLLATCYNVVGERSTRMRATLWRMDREIMQSVSQRSGTTNLDLEPLVSLEDKFSRFGIAEILFNPNGSLSKLVGHDRVTLAIYSLAEGMSTAVVGSTIVIASSPTFNSSPSPSPTSPTARSPTSPPSPNAAYTSGGFGIGSAAIRGFAWSPHSGGLGSDAQIAVVHGASMSLADTRAARVTTRVPLPAAAATVDFNPNKPYQVMTGHDDGVVRVWDVRSVRSSATPSTPGGSGPGGEGAGARCVLEWQAHSHWTTRVAYNRYHDQLVLSGSSDHQVALACIGSVSSLPVGGSDSGGGGTYYSSEDEGAEGGGGEETTRPAVTTRPPRLEDGVLATLDHLEDSVYGLAWSAADPWTYCMSSYDGRVVVNSVPNTVKYKVMGV